MSRRAQRAHLSRFFNLKRLHELFATATLVLGTTRAVSAQEYRAVTGVRIHASQRVGSVSAAVKLTNGNIVIADNANAQLHYFTANGGFIRSVGRDGEAPGEFKAVRWVGECARDTVFAFDYLQNRISVFDNEGKLVRTFSSPNVQTVMVRCGVDGTMAYVAAGERIGTASRGIVQTYSSTGKLLYRTSDLFLDEGRPLGKSIKFAVADNKLMFGNGDSAFVTLLTSVGAPLKKLPAGLVSRTPTESNRTAAMNYWATYLGNKTEVENTRRYLSTLPPVKALPAYSDMFIDDVAKVAWIQTSVLGDPGTVLERVSLDGIAQGKVSLSPNIMIQQIRGDVVVAKAMDAITGEESVVTYRLAGPAR